MSNHDYTDLIRKAFQAREKAYAPYSGFMVGAALLTREGEVYLGCNVENAAYSPTNCAERTAFFKAVSEGKRQFSAVAVVGGMKGTAQGDFAYVFPCGVCRQVMAEFCGGDFEIITAKSLEEYKTYALSELLPEAFGPEIQI
ncbi:MAG: cytidine deaminase [Clostridiales bacterium]|nr:cytidine deaminase [Clostridiales bacterium]